MYSKKRVGGKDMATTRQDAWTQDEDLLLAEVVLRHIREGGTQLGAFEEVGKRLSRTAAACGFRWNSYVRKKYKHGIELAKKQRKELKKQNQKGHKPLSMKEMKIEESNSLSLKDVIEVLKRIERSQDAEKQQLLQKIDELEERTEKLLQEKVSAEEKLKIVEGDYKALIEIMERARKMVVFQEEEKNSKVKFQMDKNGNLERVEK
jgi:prespore-specific regulator